MIDCGDDYTEREDLEDDDDEESESEHFERVLQEMREDRERAAQRAQEQREAHPLYQQALAEFEALEDYSGSAVEECDLSEPVPDYPRPAEQLPDFDPRPIWVERLPVPGVPGALRSSALCLWDHFGEEIQAVLDRCASLSETSSRQAVWYASQRIRHLLGQIQTWSTTPQPMVVWDTGEEIGTELPWQWVWTCGQGIYDFIWHHESVLNFVSVRDALEKSPEGRKRKKARDKKHHQAEVAQRRADPAKRDEHARKERERRAKKKAEKEAQRMAAEDQDRERESVLKAAEAAVADVQSYHEVDEDR